jgi:hypothetical protein
MKARFLALPLVLLLAGCAASSSRSPFDDLRHERNLRTERTVYLTFPQIQQALFKHQAACGVTYTFALEPRETSYATITFMPDASMPDETPVLVELVWYQGSWRNDERAKTKVYTAYDNSTVSRRINALFDALAKPQQCVAPDNA